MIRSGNIWFLAAVILVAVGALIFVGALAAVHFDFTEFSTQKFQTNTYEFNENFENISVDVKTATVIFVPSDEEVCRIECFEEDKLTHSVKIQDGTLMVYTVDNRKWYDHIVISFKTPTVTIYLPEEVYDSLSVVTKTGNIEIPDGFCFETVTITGTTSSITCNASVSKCIELNTTTGNISLGSSETETIELSATTGKVTANDIACNKLTAETSTGQIFLQNVIAEESIQAETSTGGVIFEGCDASDIAVKTSTGSVEGTLLSEKIFDVHTATGSIRVPDTTSGGRCEITTGTGNIEISLTAENP